MNGAHTCNTYLPKEQTERECYHLVKEADPIDRRDSAVMVHR
jgi:hypothetical protein